MPLKTSVEREHFPQKRTGGAFLGDQRLSDGNTIFWGIFFIIVGVVKLVSIIVGVIRKNQTDSRFDRALELFFTLLIITCGVLALLGIGEFVPAD